MTRADLAFAQFVPGALDGARVAVSAARDRLGLLDDPPNDLLIHCCAAITRKHPRCGRPHLSFRVTVGARLHR